MTMRFLLAHLARMDFFLNGFDLPDEESLVPAGDIAARPAALAPAPHGSLAQKSPAPRWGINE